MNNYRNEILNIFETAQTSIQVAVSWFTDELLIEKLIQKAEIIKVEVLLSSDELNLYRHKSFRTLQASGAKVNKIGSGDATEGDFMHSKFVIIDHKFAYGGSYNFTSNAITNMEVFKKYAREEVAGLLADFNDWLRRSFNLFNGISNPERIVKKLQLKFQENQSAPTTNIHVYNERNEIIKNEIKKDNLRKIESGIAAGTSTISSEGKVERNNNGIKSKPHRFYGGISGSLISAKSDSCSYLFAHYQKHFIEKQYKNVKTQIVNNTLFATLELQPDNCDLYKVRIEFKSGFAPIVTIKSPKIEPCDDIHMYDDCSLCLFYPGDIKWKNNLKIAEYTIPWIIEWIICYEIYKLTGKWEGPEKGH